MERNQMMSSKEKKQKTADKKLNGQNPEADVVIEALSELEPNQAEIEALKLELEETQIKYDQALRALADAENRKKRLIADVEIKRNAALREFSLNLLAIVDNFERALADEQGDFESLKKGVDMIYQQLMEVLNDQGVYKMDAIAQEFDANQHHAIATEATDDIEPNKVMEVFQEGYMFKDKLLRAAMVKVSERKSEE